MKVLALSGPIASGKSTVGGFFEKLGATLIDADSLAHRVYRPGSPVYRAIVKRYGRRILQPNRRIDRKGLAGIVFRSKKERKWLESVTHPATLRLIGKLMQKAIRDKSPLILVEAALHVETGYYRSFEGLILVKATPEIQIRRLVKHKAKTPAEARLRVKSQMPIAKLLRYADWVIDNSGSLKETRRQVKKLYKKLTL